MTARITLNRPDTRSKVRKPGVLRDAAYRRSAKGRECDVPGCEDQETVVLAHIRMAGNCGTGLKPPDDESLFLCHRHHDEFDGRRAPLPDDWGALRNQGRDNPVDRAMWIVRNIVIPLRRENYRRWKAER